MVQVSSRRRGSRQNAFYRSLGARFLCERLESRLFLSGFTFTLTDQGSNTANGTYLKKLINGQTTLSNAQVSNHVLALGDTLILPNNLIYDMGAVELGLPNLGTAATVTLDANGGVASALVSFTGGNFGNITSAPVTFIGGGGSGATGIATIVPNGVTGFVISNNGNTYTTAPTVIFGNGGTGGNNAAATAVLTTYIDSVKIVNGGTGYDANTTVTFTGGLGVGGVAATGHILLNGTAIKNVVIDSAGSGYTSTPTFTFSDPGGSGTGASGYGAFGIDHFTITNNGTGYTSAPTVSFSGGGGTGASVNAIIDGVTSIAITNAGSGYTFAPAVSLPAGTLTIESSAIGSLPAGTRINPQNPAQEALLVKVIGSDGAGIVGTEDSDNYGHSGAAHDFALYGMDVCPSDSTKVFTGSFVAIGDGSSTQDDVALAPYNFTIGRTFIHGGGFTGTTYIGDDQGNTGLAINYSNGITLNCFNATIADSYISDIHSYGAEAHGISGDNGLGNYTITDNFIEATGENFFNGGAVESIPDGTPTNITLSHNYLFKRLAWDPFWANYVPFVDKNGVTQTMDVKNLFELKHAINVLVDSNLFENSWVGADQIGQAITIGPKNQGADSPWTTIAYVTITNNIIRNTGTGITLSTDGLTTQGKFVALPLHDVLVQNNLIENMLTGATDGGGAAFSLNCGSYLAAGWNISFDHNTAVNCDHFFSLDSGTGVFNNIVLSGFTFTNNINFFGEWGGLDSDGEGLGALEAFGPVANMLNGGSGYTSIPTVTFVGGLGAGGTAASATAMLNATVSGYSNLVGGSGYTSAPTIVISDMGGSQAAATATLNGSGGIGNITLVSDGGGFTAAPTITFVGGGGTGASATAVMGPDGSGFLAITGFTNIVAGTGYTSAPVMEFGVGGAGLIVNPIMGSDGSGHLMVTGLYIVNAGADYFAAPQISFVGGGGSGASATLNISGSIVGFQTEFNVKAPLIGSGYTSLPTIQITGGGGSGATASTYLYATVISASVSNGGSGYTGAPTVTLSGGGGIGATATATYNSTTHVVSGVTITNAGTGYSAAPTISFSGGGGTGAVATAAISGSLVGTLCAGNVLIGTPTSKVSLYPNASSTNSNFYNNYTTTNEDSVGFLDPSGDQFGLVPTIAGGGANPLKGTATNNSNGSFDPGVNMAAYASNPDFLQIDATMQHYWKFDEGSGTAAGDSGLGTPAGGVLSGSATWDGGVINSGLVLSGGNSGSVSVGNFSTTANFSFVAWVKPASFGTAQYIASAGNSAFSLYVNGAGQLVASGTTGSIVDTTALTAGNWTLVGMTFDGTNLRLFKNGVQVGAATAGTTTAGSTTLTLGGDQGNFDSFNGRIDEVRYYNSALNGNVTPISTITLMQGLYNGYVPEVDTIGPGSSAKQVNLTSVFSTYALAHGDSEWISARGVPSSVYFTWSATGPGAVTWSVAGGANGTNAAAKATATWGASGNYIVMVTVTDMNGTGASTTIYHPITVKLTVPNAPTALAASSNASSVGLSWTDNATNETGFHIWQSTDGVHFTQIGSTGTGVTGFTDSAATDPTFTVGQQYYYYVTATNASGDSAASNTITAATAGSDHTAPAVGLVAPTVGAITNGPVVAISGIGGIATGDLGTVTVKVYAGGTATGSPVQTLVTSVDASTGAYGVDSGALADGQYTIQASQGDSFGNTGTSAAVTIRVDTVAPVISITSPAAGSYTDGSAPTINGTAGMAAGDANTVAVRIFAGTSATGTPVQTLTGGVTPGTGAFSVTPGTLTWGQYTLQAIQTDSAGNTGWGAAVTVIVPIPGDVNHDNIVDGADFDIWFTHLGTIQTPWTNGDMDGSGLVDGADFDIWFTHLGVKMTLLPDAAPAQVGAALVESSGMLVSASSTQVAAVETVTPASAAAVSVASTRVVVAPAATAVAAVTAPVTKRALKPRARSHGPLFVWPGDGPGIVS